MGNSGSSKKRVCIIGAGPAGLIAIKEFSAKNEVFDVVCMEEMPVFGGLWNYSHLPSKSTQTNTDSSRTTVYKNLRTSTPKQLMSFSDMPFKDTLPSFLHHSDVKEYLDNYAKKHKIQKYIKFNTRVKSVRPGRVFGGQNGWQVEAVNVVSNKTESCHFDIVIVCNGIHVKPYFPTVKGMTTFKGKMIHSQDYKDPEDFRNKKVVVLGTKLSGVDIALDVSKTAQKVWLSHKDTDRKNIPDVIEQVREVIEFTKKEVIVRKWEEYGREMNKKSSDVVKKEMGERKTEKENEENKGEYLEGVDGGGIKSEEKMSGNNGVSINLQGGLMNEDGKKEDEIKGINPLEMEVQIKEISSLEILDENDSGEIKEDENDAIKSVDDSKNEVNKSSQEVSKELEDSLRLDQVDVVIFCTGFERSMSFLNANCGVSVVNKEVVSPLFKDVICLGRQTLSFIGLHSHGTLPLLEVQAKFLRAFYEERFKIPLYGEELLRMVEKDDEIKSLRGVDVVKEPLDISLYQWEYMNDLASVGGFEGVHERYERLSNEVHQLRNFSHATYQHTEFEINADGFYINKKTSNE